MPSLLNPGSFEKQALSPALLGRALKAVTKTGNPARAMKMAGRTAARSEGVAERLHQLYMKSMRLNEADAIEELSHSWKSLRDISHNVGYNIPLPSHYWKYKDGLTQGRAAMLPYANKVEGKLLDGLRKQYGLPKRVEDLRKIYDGPPEAPVSLNVLRELYIPNGSLLQRLHKY